MEFLSAQVPFAERIHLPVSFFDTRKAGQNMPAILTRACAGEVSTSVLTEPGLSSRLSQLCSVAGERREIVGTTRYILPQHPEWISEDSVHWDTKIEWAPV